MWKTYLGAAAGSGTGQPAPVMSPSRSGPGGWEPPALYLVGLVVAEIVAVAVLSRHLLK